MTDVVTPAKVWMIWNGRSSVWWRDDSCGYTRDLAEAGLYTKAEAERHSRPEQHERPVHIAEHAEYLRRSLERIRHKVQLLCAHTTMKERVGDAQYAWECADCGYVYGTSHRGDASRREEDRVSETTATPPGV